MNQGIEISDKTFIPLSWMWKAFGLLLLAIPAIWWAATMEERTRDLPEMRGQLQIINQRLAVIEVQVTTEKTVTQAKPFKTSSTVEADDVSRSTIYAAALIKHQTSRIQIDDLCSATPQSETWKSGTSVMIDNRGTQPHSISFGENIFTIPAGSFITAVVKSSIRVTYDLDCDKKQNVGQYLIQT